METDDRIYLKWTEIPFIWFRNPDSDQNGTNRIEFWIKATIYI